MTGGWAVRAALTVYRAALLLLPGSFRADWRRTCLADLKRSLDAAEASGGVRGVAAAGAAAVWDVMRAAPGEWRRAATRVVHGGWEGTMSWMSETRQAGRALARRPGYTGAALLTLALGIGATVAIFSVVDAVVLRRLPYPDADRLVTIRHHAPGLGLELSSSPGTFRFYRAEADYLQTVAGFGRGALNLTGGDRPERVDVVMADPHLFGVLGARPALGRTIAEADAVEGPPTVAVLGHRLWTTRFGADTRVVGRTVQLDGRAVEVVGVMPAGFGFPDADVDLYVPLWIDPDGPFGAFGNHMLARLAPGVSLEAARSRTTELQAAVADYFPGVTSDFLDQAGWSASLHRYQDWLVGERVASALWIILATVGVVLLIAYANVANLFLVRAEGRRKEIAVRSAMGASRRRVAGSFLAEAAVLGIAGGAVGVLVGWLGVDQLVAHGPEAIPRLHEVSLGARGVGMAAALSIGAALALGLVPWLRYGAAPTAGILRDGGRGGTAGRDRHRGRNALVAGQLALALMLLVGSALMFRSFRTLQAIDPGIDGRDVTVVGLSLPVEMPRERAAAFYQNVADEVGTLPGVASVGLSAYVPVGGGNSNGGSFYVESRPRTDDELPPVSMYKPVGADYLGTVRQNLVAGRPLTRSDWEGGPPVALVNRTFADRFFDGRPVGERIKWDEDAEFAEIVGVVEDVREARLQEEPGPWVYLPMVVGDWSYPGLERMYVFVRAEPGVPVAMGAVRSIVARLDPDVPLTSVRTMDDVLAEGMVDTSFTMLLLGIAAGVALFLGAVGLFGVVSYVVGQRTREIGVRVALGAEASEIRAMVLRQGVGVATVGAALGMVGAALLSRFMAAVLYGVEPTDPLSFTAAPVALLAVAALATWLPALRATRVDPLVALRSE